MEEVKDIRRASVLALISERFHGKQASFARAIGKDDAQVWQMLNNRNIGERIAREIEQKLELEDGALSNGSLLADEARPLLRKASPVAFLRKGVPVVGTAELGPDGYYHELEYPVGHGDGFVEYPTKDKNAYALRVKGDSMRPRIKHGEFVVIEPNTPLVIGEEVLCKTRDGRSMVKILDFQRNGIVQLSSVNDEHKPITVEQENIDRLHYVAAIVKATLYYRAIS